MKHFLSLLTLCGSLAWAYNTCTSVTGSHNLSSPASWTACNGTTPQPGDLVVIGDNSATTTLTIDADIDIGSNLPPLTGYVRLVRSGGTSGYAGDKTQSCTAGVVSGGAGHAAKVQCTIINGQLSFIPYDRGSYTLAPTTLSAITTTGLGTIAGARTYRTGTTTGDGRVVPAGKTRMQYSLEPYWVVGSVQYVTLQGAAGSWSGMNGPHAATVVQDVDNSVATNQYSQTAGVRVVDIDFDSSGLTGTPAGVVDASTTSTTIGTGSKTFTVSSGQMYGVNNNIVVQYDSTHKLTGTVTSYSGATLVVNVASVTGSGTYAFWTMTQEIDTFPATPATYVLNYEAGGGPLALRVTKNAKIVLAPGVTARVRGDVGFTQGTYPDSSTWLTFGGGSHFIVDGSASAGTYGPYVYTISEDLIGPTAGTFRLMDVSACTSASPCSLEGTAVAPVRLISRSATGNGPYVSWLPTPQSGATKPITVKCFGDAEMNGLTIAQNGDTTNAMGIRMHDTLWLNSGAIETVTPQDGAKLYLDWSNFETRGTLSNYAMNIMSGSALPTTGVRQIVNSVFDKPLGKPTLSMDINSFTISNNVFLGGIYHNPTNRTWLYTDNVMRHTGCYVSFGTLISGLSPSDFYHVYDCDWATNLHYFSNAASGLTVTDFMFQIAGSNTNDSGELFSQTPNSTLTYNHIWLLPSSDGWGGLEFGDLGMMSGQHITLQHSLWTGENAFGAIQMDENQSNTAGTITFRSNLMWIPAWSLSASPKRYKFDWSNFAPPTDACASAADCDYNSYSGWTVQSPCTGCANAALGYSGAWSVTPGTPGGVGYHDRDANPPAFRHSWNGVPEDGSNSLLNWDQWFLGYPLSGMTWDGVTDYAYGAAVSGYYTWRQDGTPDGRYGNQKFNYVCINLSGCPHSGRRPGVMNPEPEVNTMGVAAWQNNWLWGGFYYLSQAVLSGATITDNATRPTSGFYPAVGCASCTPIQALLNSMHAIYAPSNQDLKGAAHDATDIGPMTIYTASCPTAYPGSILPACNTLARLWSTSSNGGRE